MNWENYLRFILALLFVLGLIGVLTMLVRRFGVGIGNTPMRKGSERRLKLVEILQLDAKRRAILLRRDDVEHLVILGPESETVVEAQIMSPSQSTPNAKSNTQDFSDVLEANSGEKA